MMNVKYFLGVLFFLSACLLTNATPIIILDNDISQYNVNDKIEIYVNKNLPLSFEEISTKKYEHKFKALKDITDIYNADIKEYWVRVKIKNNADTEKFVFTLDQWDYAKIYYKDKTGKTEFYKDGTILKLKEKKERFGRFTYLILNLPKGKQNTFYIKLASQTSIDGGMRKVFQYFKRFNLDSYKTAQENYDYATYFFCFYIGLLAIIILYKTVLFFFIKDKSYLFFALFSLCMFFYILIESDLALVLFYPNTPNLAKGLLLFLLALSMFFFNIFIQQYLQLKNAFPKLHKLYYFMGSTYVVSYIIAYLFNPSFFIAIILFNIPNNLINLYANIISIRRGFKPANYFLVANIVMIISLFFAILLSVGIVNYEFIIINFPLHLGNILEIAIMAIGLAYRMNILKREAEIQKEEKRILLENQQKILEEEVQKKTFHIQEQTEELQVQNEELKQTTEEMLAQRDYIEEKNKDLEKYNQKLQSSEQILKKVNEKMQLAKAEVEEKNKILANTNQQLSLSIKSAKTIQEALLPTAHKLARTLGEFFLMYRPKDVVSGDFYWVTQDENKIYLAVADCTGHGVPGAFMANMGITFLYNIIQNKKMHNLAIILETLHREISVSLKQSKTGNNNGMDIALLTLEKQSSHSTKLEFCGAKRPLYYISSETKVLQEVKGTRRAIGGIQNKKVKFEVQNLTLPQDSLLYVGSDGFADQNNIRRKKFGAKRLKKLLEEIQTLPLWEQKVTLEFALDQHMQKTKQRDDILWMGIRM